MKQTPQQRLDSLRRTLYFGKDECAPCVYRADLLDSAAYAHRRAAGYLRAVAKAAQGAQHGSKAMERVTNMFEVYERELFYAKDLIQAADLANRLHADGTVPKADT